MNMSTDIASIAATSGLSQRYGMPLLQQLRPQQQPQPRNQSFPAVPYLNTVQSGVQPAQDTEKKMMNPLRELEKQLLEDNDDEEGDALSVITNTNSEWSETIQNLISGQSPAPSPNPNPNPNPNPIPNSPSPTTSSSSSSSSSVASPVSVCSRQTIMETASAISEGKTDVASEILARFPLAPNPTANSEQKLMEFILSALKSRVNPVENPPPVAELYGKDHVNSTPLLYELSPCFKLGFMAANLAILEATLEQPSNNGFHVIDFDIGQGEQYIHLFHALSARQNGKPAVVKITAVVDNVGGVGDERFRVVGEVLTQKAERFGVCLKFNVVTSSKLSNLSRESLGCEPDEPLAVNFAFKLYRVPDESVSTENPRDELLRRVKGLAPRVVTLVEQEMNANTAPFLSRVGETCAYYGALLDSIESTVPRDNPDRVKVEEALGRKLANSVACEGRDRVERCEVFGKWRARMGMAGFVLKPMSQAIAESMRARLTSGNRVHRGFTVKEENGGVFFGWMGRSLTVASAWRLT